MISKVAVALAMIMLFLVAGCASLKITRESLDDTVKGYQQMVRWQEFPAAAAFVAKPARQEYLEKAAGFDRVKIVDYRIKSVDFSPEQRKATVLVEFDYHLKSGVSVKTVSDTQKWEYFETAEPEGWRLTSLPPAFP